MLAVATHDGQRHTEQHWSAEWRKRKKMARLQVAAQLVHLRLARGQLALQAAHLRRCTLSWKPFRNSGFQGLFQDIGE